MQLQLPKDEIEKVVKFTQAADAEIGRWRIRDATGGRVRLVEVGDLDGPIAGVHPETSRFFDCADAAEARRYLRLIATAAALKAVGCVFGGNRKTRRRTRRVAR